MTIGTAGACALSVPIFKYRLTLHRDFVLFVSVEFVSVSEARLYYI
jgi:hypothetical protein